MWLLITILPAPFFYQEQLDISKMLLLFYWSLCLCKVKTRRTNTSMLDKSLNNSILFYSSKCNIRLFLFFSCLYSLAHHPLAYLNNFAYCNLTYLSKVQRFCSLSLFVCVCVCVCVRICVILAFLKAYFIVSSSLRFVVPLRKP